MDGFNIDLMHKLQSQTLKPSPRGPGSDVDVTFPHATHLSVVVGRVHPLRSSDASCQLWLHTLPRAEAAQGLLKEHDKDSKVLTQPQTPPNPNLDKHPQEASEQA